MSVPTLFEYVRQAQRFMRDAKQQLIDPADWEEYANRARREVAMRSQCVRILPPISGAMSSPTVTCNYKIFRLFLLKHEPHSFYIISGKAPIPF